MTTDKSNANNSIGRRGFLKSIFGLRGAVEAKSAVAKEKVVVRHVAPVFVWADLKTGQVGFPTGLHLGAGRPGSLMKIVAAAALHEEGLVNPNQTVNACDRSLMQCLFHQII